MAGAVKSPATVKAPQRAPSAQAMTLQRKCACGQHTLGGLCEECSKSSAETVQRSAAATGSSAAGGGGDRGGADGAPQDPAAGSEEPRFAHDLTQVPSLSTPAPRGVTIGPVGDRFEREADRVADMVLARGAPAVGRVPLGELGEGFLVAAQPDLPAISPLVQFHVSEPAQANAASASPPGWSAPDTISDQLVRTQGGGQGLPGATRGFMEQRFGFDFGSVRVHTDVESGRMSESLGAVAFTHGQDIYFAPGAYNPGTPEGDKLLAHELTHTIQQSGGSEAGGLQRRMRGVIQRACPISGNGAHDKIQDLLRAEDSELITEAPIPGAVRDKMLIVGTSTLDSVGRADLFKTPGGPVVSGVYGSYSTADKDLPVDQRTLKFKSLSRGSPQTLSGPPKRSPTVVEKTQTFTGEFAPEYIVGEIKPLHIIGGPELTKLGTKVGEAVAQVGNYVKGFEQFSNEAKAQNKVTHGTKGRTFHNDELKIPDGINYPKQFLADANKTAASGKGNVVLGLQRLWVHYVPNLGALYYFCLPHPYQASEYTAAIDKVFNQLKGVVGGLRKPAHKQKISPKIDLPTKRREGTPAPRPGAVEQPASRSRPAQAPPARTRPSEEPAPRPPAGRPVIQRKEGPTVDWKAEGQAWEQQRAKWDREQGKPFLAKEGKILGEKLAVDKALGIPSPDAATASQGKEFRSIELWSGLTGVALGKGRFLLGGVFDKIADFYDKIKERFTKVHAKMKSASTGGGGWKGKLIKVVVEAAKIGLKELLRAVYAIFANCFTGVIHKVVDNFVEDIEQSQADRLKEIHKAFEDFERKFKEEFEAKIGSWEKLVEAISDVTKWVSLVLTLINVVRAIVQLISCVAPPALGCLWGLVTQLAGELLLEIGIPLIADSQEFKDQIIQPKMQELVKEYAGDEIQNLINFALGKVGLDDYVSGENKVEACVVNMPPLGTILAPTAGSVPGAQLGAVRDQWQKDMAPKMVKDLAANMTTAGGRTPTEDDVLALVREIRNKNIPGDRLRKLAQGAIDPRTNKLNIDTLRSAVAGPLRPAEDRGNPPSISQQAPPPKSGGGFFVGPIEGPPAGDKAPPTGGVGPGFRF